MAIGQVAHFPAGTCQLELLKIVEDSRCPKGVDCFWEGRIVVEIGLGQNDERRSSTIAMQGEKAVPAFIECGGDKLRLLAVFPYPEGDQKIVPEVYRVRFVVE